MGRPKGSKDKTPRGRRGLRGGAASKGADADGTVSAGGDDMLEAAPTAASRSAAPAAAHAALRLLDEVEAALLSARPALEPFLRNHDSQREYTAHLIQMAEHLLDAQGAGAWQPPSSAEALVQTAGRLRLQSAAAREAALAAESDDADGEESQAQT